MPAGPESQGVDGQRKRLATASGIGPPPPPPPSSFRGGTAAAHTQRIFADKLQQVLVQQHVCLVPGERSVAAAQRPLEVKDM